MASNNYSSMIVTRCEGCVNVEGIRCEIYKDPSYQWKKGLCTGRLMTREKIKQIKADIREYASRECVL